MAHGKTKQTTEKTVTTKVTKREKRDAGRPVSAMPEGWDREVLASMSEHETKAFREALGKVKNTLADVEGGDEVIGAVPATVKLFAKFKGDKDKLNELVTQLKTAANIYANATASQEINEIFGIS